MHQNRFVWVFSHPLSSERTHDYRGGQEEGHQQPGFVRGGMEVIGDINRQEREKNIKYEEDNKANNRDCPKIFSP